MLRSDVEQRGVQSSTGVHSSTERRWGNKGAQHVGKLNPGSGGSKI